MDHLSNQASGQFWMWLIGVIIVIFQAIQVLQQRTQNIYTKWNNDKIEGLVKQIEAVWKRVNTHGHDIECNQADCKPKTTGVKLTE